MSAELFLSGGDTTPMYQQIVDQITAKVIAGDWKPGQALPSIRELASTSRVSVITVKRAYTELGLAGIIVTRLGISRNEIRRLLAEEQPDPEIESSGGSTP